MKLALFFTEAVSLDTWDKGGMLSREIRPYLELKSFFEEIYFVTYGKNDLKYADKVGQGITILPKKLNIPNRLYSLLVPFIYHQELHSCGIFKTNQMLGSWSAVLAKIVYRKLLVVRCGYQLSQSPQNWNMGPVKKFLAYLIEFVSYKMADAIILTSKLAQDYVCKRYRIDENKVSVLSNYVDTNLFRTLAVPKFTNSIIFVGRLEKEKNLDSLIKALVGTNYTLDIVGVGGLEGYLKDLAQSLRIKVNFLGKIPNENLSQELCKHEFFILPSFYEGNPKALLEAMACGLVVLSSNIPGINDIISNGNNGFLCGTGSEAIKVALQKITIEVGARKIVSENARQYVIDNCGLPNIIAKEKSIYNKLRVN